MDLEYLSILADIDTYIRAYPETYAQNLNLNRVCKRILGYAAGGVSGSTLGQVLAVEITSANFINATDCPIPTLAGYNISIFWDDRSNRLKPSEWTPYAGGGFTVLVDGFDATANNYSFLVTPIS